MQPTIPALDPLPMPAPPWLLWFLLMLTFTLHVLAMNFVLGGSLIAAIARFRKNEHAPRLAKSMGKAMPTVFAAAITFGVAPLLFLQALYGRLFFTSTVLMGWFWFAVVPVVIVAYYGAYSLAFRGVAAAVPGRRETGAALIAVAVAAILLTVAFLYTNNMSLMVRPEKFLPMFLADARGVQLNLGDATLIPRYLHMLFGALAVAGMVVALYGVVKSRTDEEHGRWAIRHGALWFVVPTLMNLVTGVLWLGTLPPPVTLRFMGGDALATVWLAAGIVLGFVAMAMMLLAIASQKPQALVTRSAWLLLGTLVAMILARDEVRRGMLEASGFAIATWIEPQWDVIAIFGVLLVGAFAVTGWMLWIGMPRAGSRPSTGT